MSNDLMDPRVAQVYEVLFQSDLVFDDVNAIQLAQKIVEALDEQAAKLAERGA